MTDDASASSSTGGDPIGGDPIYPWQQEIWQQLQQQIGQQRLHHGLLIAGNAGLGKRSFANKLVAGLHCLQPAQGYACGRCKSCQQLAAGSLPDHILIEPEAAGKAVKVDQVRELGDFLVQTAQAGKYKTVIMDHAEAMNINASNALLKSLEEPAGRSVLILCCDQESRLLPTIKSRCQLLTMRGPNLEQGVLWLSALVGGDDKAKDLWQLSGGSPLKALAWAQNDVLQLRDQLLKDLSSDDSVIRLAENWHKEHALTAVIWLQNWLVQLIKQRGCNAQDIRSSLPQKIQHQPLPIIYALLDEVSNQRELLSLPNNLNKQMIMENLFTALKLCAAGQMAPAPAAYRRSL